MTSCCTGWLVLWESQLTLDVKALEWHISSMNVGDRILCCRSKFSTYGCWKCSVSSSMKPSNDIPDELLIQVLDLLEPKERVQLACTCKNFNNLFKEEVFTLMSFASTSESSQAGFVKYMRSWTDQQWQALLKFRLHFTQNLDINFFGKSYAIHDPLQKSSKS